MRSIQLGPSLIWWIRGISLCNGVGVHKSLTSITQGKSCAKDVVRVAKESAWVFPPLGICDMSKNSNFVCIHLTWLKYSCILGSRTSKSPLTWPTTSFESKNTFTVFPLIFWTIIIPINIASYSASLFVVEKPNLKDFSMVIFSEDTRTSPTPDPCQFAAPSTYTSQGVEHWIEITPTDFSSMPCFSTFIFSGHSANSVTRSARTCPFIEVRGMYFISKAPRIVPHLATLPV